jgi:hypothetical protein
MSLAAEEFLECGWKPWQLLVADEVYLKLLTWRSINERGDVGFLQGFPQMFDRA